MTTLNYIKKYLLKGLNCEDGSEDYYVGLILLASANVGPNIRHIARWSHLPYSIVTPIARNCRKHGIWKGSKVVHSGWFDKKTGGIAFCCDMLVVQNMLKRVNKSKTQETN